MAVYLAVACGVYGGVFLCCPFSHEVSWMRSLTLLSQFLRVFLPTLILYLYSDIPGTKNVYYFLNTELIFMRLSAETLSYLQYLAD